jgi:hypothetical protein
MILSRVGAAVVWVSHAPTTTFFQRVSDYAETVVFGFHVDSEGASSVGVLRSWVFSGDSFLLQQHRSELRLKPWLFCRLCGLTGTSESET